MNKTIKYFYSRPTVKVTIAANPFVDKTVISAIKPCKRYTIAVVYDDDDKTIKFGLAICRPMDNFCKAIGREISTTNAIKNPFCVISEYSGCRNEYAQEIKRIVKEKEMSLLRQEIPHLFNPNYFID